jgi:tRNA U34 2-thiouridine synthase MnmA/TrmU
MRVYARVRYRQPLVKATLKLINSQTHQLSFAAPQRFVAPGQSAVFYKSSPSTSSGSKSQDFEMLGGGVIV